MGLETDWVRLGFVGWILTFVLFCPFVFLDLY